MKEGCESIVVQCDVCAGMLYERPSWAQNKASGRGAHGQPRVVAAGGLVAVVPVDVEGVEAAEVVAGAGACVAAATSNCVSKGQQHNQARLMAPLLIISPWRCWWQWWRRRWLCRWTQRCPS